MQSRRHQQCGRGISLDGVQHGQRAAYDFVRRRHLLFNNGDTNVSLALLCAVCNMPESAMRQQHSLSRGYSQARTALLVRRRRFTGLRLRRRHDANNDVPAVYVVCAEYGDDDWSDMGRRLCALIMPTTTCQLYRLCALFWRRGAIVQLVGFRNLLRCV